jgi:hypothetical protein
MSVAARRRQRGSTVLTLSNIEQDCDAKGITLVLHPAIRKAVKGFEESFYIGACCFLRGETDGVYFLPLRTGGYVRLRFTKRLSAGRHAILRVDALTSDGLGKIKTSLKAAA